MTRAEIVTARLQQRRWLGARPGNTVDTLALEARSSWSEPLTTVAVSEKAAVGQWRSPQATGWYRARARNQLETAMFAASSVILW